MKDIKVHIILYFTVKGQKNYSDFIGSICIKVIAEMVFKNDLFLISDMKKENMRS